MSTATGLELMTGLEGVDNDAFQAMLDPYWPSGLTYRGLSVFNDVYGWHGRRTIMEEIESTGLLPHDSQECYLGYDPESDVFVIGFDGFRPDDYDRWTDHGGDDTVFTFKIDKDGVRHTIRPVDGMRLMFYGRKESNLDDLHERFPKLLDIRLD